MPVDEMDNEMDSFETEEEPTKSFETETKPIKGRNAADKHVIFIGSKPFMNYVTGVVMQFTTQNAPEVIIRARGKFISREVDVAEVTAKRFLENNIQIGDIKIDSEEFENKEGRLVRVSSIDIVLKKK